MNERVRFGAVAAGAAAVLAALWWTLNGAAPVSGAGCSDRSHKLRLEEGTVRPATGSPSTVFTFSVIYRDNAGCRPTRITVSIRGVGIYALSGRGTNYRQGVTFSFRRTLPRGSWSYSFAASSGSGAGARTVTLTSVSPTRAAVKAAARPPAATPKPAAAPKATAKATPKSSKATRPAATRSPNAGAGFVEDGGSAGLLGEDPLLLTGGLAGISLLALGGLWFVLVAARRRWFVRTSAAISAGMAAMRTSWAETAIAPHPAAAASAGSQTAVTLSGASAPPITAAPAPSAAPVATVDRDDLPLRTQQFADGYAPPPGQQSRFDPDDLPLASASDEARSPYATDPTDSGDRLAQRLTTDGDDLPLASLTAAYADDVPLASHTADADDRTLDVDMDDQPLSAPGGHSTWPAAAAGTARDHHAMESSWADAVPAEPDSATVTNGAHSSPDFSPDYAQPPRPVEPNQDLHADQDEFHDGFLVLGPSARVGAGEAHLPRWRRPSVQAARESGYGTTAELRPALRFGDFPAPGVQRAMVRYRLVRVSDAPDDRESAEIGRLDRDDEVEITGFAEGFVRVRAPDGLEGWIARHTVRPTGDTNAAAPPTAEPAGTDPASAASPTPDPDTIAAQPN